MAAQPSPARAPVPSYCVDVYVRDVVASERENPPIHIVISAPDAEKAIGAARRLVLIGGRWLDTGCGFSLPDRMQRSYLVQFERTLKVRFQAREVRP